MRSRSKIINIFGRVRHWVLTVGIVLTLVVSPQVWASIAYFCEPQHECEGSGCQTANHHDAIAEMQDGTSRLDTSTSCDTSTQATVVVKAPCLSPEMEVCCILQPQSVPTARIVSARNHIHAVTAKSADGIHWFAAPVSTPTVNLTCPRSQRPLYLAFSCLLI